MTATTPEDRLVRSLPALRALVDSLATRSPSTAAELLRLDILVFKYPAAARASLRLLERPHAVAAAPAGWSAAWDADGLPLWRWSGGRVWVATGDLDQLRFIGAALARFDRMTGEELQAYMRATSGPHTRWSHFTTPPTSLRLPGRNQKGRTA